MPRYLPTILLLLMLFSVVLGRALPAGASTGVLVLHSYHPGLSWTDDITAGIKSAFADSGQDVQLHFQYLDTKRFNDERYLQHHMRSYFSYKINQIDFDLVIAADNNAYNFVREERLDLFAGRPVVFCGVNGFRPHQIYGLKDITGIAETPDLKNTLNLVRKLHSERREIIVVGSIRGATGLENHAQFIGLEATFPDLTFTYLNDFTLEELRQRVARLGDGQVLYLSSTVRKADGHALDFTETAEQLSQAGDVPVYGSWDFFLGHGIVGGKLINGRAQGLAAAELALRIIQGTIADQLPVRRQAGTRYMFDYNVLQRFGIVPDQLPSGSVLINQPRSFYSINKMTVWIGGAVAAVLVLFSLALIRQMAQLRRYGRALKDNEARYRTMFEDNHAVMLMTEPQSGAIVDANRAACDYYGYSHESLTGLKLSDISQARARPGRDAAHEVATGEHQGDRSSHRLADGRMREVEVFSGPIQVDGQTLRYSIVHDVTDRVELEQQVRQKFKMEGIGVMAGGIAHNFNNSLAVMLGSLEMALRRISHPETVKDYLDTARVAALRARDLVAQIMTYSRQGAQEHYRLDLVTVVGEAQKLLKSTLPTSVTLAFRADQEAGELFIMGDPGQLQQCLLNLCNNAVYALNEQGGVLIDLSRMAVSVEDIPGQYHCSPGDYVRLRVEDRGCGMDARTVERIFDPFYTTKAVNEGTGMGLATVQGIVEQHLGFIRVNSAIGQGSSFELFFPVAIGESPERRPSVQSEDLLTGSERILLVDDDPQMARLGSEILAHLGYQVVSATDPHEALRQFAEATNDFDLLLTDQTMPGLTGIELARQVRQINPAVPVILMTGYSSKICPENLAEYDITAFCQKPLQLTELSRLVRDVLQGEPCQP